MTIFNLSFSQCKTIIDNTSMGELRDLVERLNDQPEWLQSMGLIESVSELMPICDGGCASGAYMPAVTYFIALETMSKHGDEILDYIESQLGEIPPPRKGESWSGLAVFYSSYAVELWCGQFSDSFDGVEY